MVFAARIVEQDVQQKIEVEHVQNTLINVTGIVEEDVDEKIDTDFVQKSLTQISEKTAIIFVCVNDDWRKDDTWRKKGTKYYRIVMPYEQVKKMSEDEVRALMLKMAKERLAMPKKKLAPAVAPALASA